jgi:hypothetical protein
MFERNPTWSAKRLNEEVGRIGQAPIALSPYGTVIPVDPYPKQIKIWSADGSFRTEDDPLRVAEVEYYKVRGLEPVQTNVSSIPHLLACCAIDPDAWSAVIFHPGALDGVGPFRTVSSPLRDWLIRAASLGRVGKETPANISLWNSELNIQQALAFFSSERPRPLTTNIQSELSAFPLPDLVPSRSANLSWLAEYLDSFEATQLAKDGGQLKKDVKSPDDAVALKAGLWQMNGFLEQSHELAQSVEGGGREKAGDYWHAIMHRREPDYPNAKYWFRRVGTHGIHPFLARDSDGILSECSSPAAKHWRSKITGNSWEKWNPLAFVDLCEQLVDADDSDLLLAARQIQLIEMVLLLKSTHHYTFDDAP